MKTYSISLIFLCIVLVGGTVLGQSEKAQIKQYKTFKETVISGLVPFTMERRMELFQSMDSIPRIVWGKVNPRFLSDKKIDLSSNSYLVGFYDYDNDRIADQFRFKTLEGKELQQDFGFLYDLNKDGKIDYIIYNGGTMISRENEFYYFFYHWIDTDYDGNIDAVVNNIVIFAEDNRPDPTKCLWIMDSNKDGKTDLVDFVDMQTGDNISLVPTDGIWNYKTSFGIKKVDPSDEAYFRFYNMYLKAINSSLNGT